MVCQRVDLQKAVFLHRLSSPKTLALSCQKALIHSFHMPYYYFWNINTISYMFRLPPPKETADAVGADNTIVNCKKG